METAGKVNQSISLSLSLSLSLSCSQSTHMHTHVHVHNYNIHMFNAQCSQIHTHTHTHSQEAQKIFTAKHPMENEFAASKVVYNYVNESSKKETLGIIYLA